MTICVSKVSETRIILFPIATSEGVRADGKWPIVPGQMAFGRDFDWWSKACPVVRVDDEKRAHEAPELANDDIKDLHF